MTHHRTLNLILGIICFLVAAGLILLIVVLVNGGRLDAPAPPAVAVANQTAEPVELEPVELGSGNYEVGIDFPAGVYDVVAVEGTGTVTSSDLEINAMIGITEEGAVDDGFYESEYQNIQLHDGITLKVKGVDIRLIPN